jgi:HK97 gp10 family phage protein
MSIKITVRQRGLDLKVFAGKTRDVLTPQLVDRVADVAYDEMRRTAPVRSGMLRGSIRKLSRGQTVTVGPTVPYAMYVEYGTGPHEIRPVYARCLAFQVGLETVFAAVVQHPGTRPNPFIRRAGEKAKSETERLWLELLEENVG